MRTPKQVYPTSRRIYHPELSACLVCGGPVVLANYLLWDKTVLTLEQVLSVASRPAACADPCCPGATRQLRSAEAQQIALPHSSFGYDVLAYIGWHRQQHHQTFAEIHAQLSPQVLIGQSTIRYLYNQVFLPLLACHERLSRDQLAQAAQLHGGLVLALDGLCPEAGEPQLWCIRELLTDRVLRSGWLARQDQATFQAFLQPVLELQLPISAIVSDKQRGLVPAIASCFPATPHQFCQSHYLRNLAEPLARADTTLNVSLRHAVSRSLSALLPASAQANQTTNVTTITGVLAQPLPAVLADSGDAADAGEAADASPAATSPAATSATGDMLVTQLLHRARYLLTLKGRPPERLAGVETYEQLHELAERCALWLNHRHDERLEALQAGLERALAEVAPLACDIATGAGWLKELATILAPATAPAQPRGGEVAARLQSYLTQLNQEDCTPWLAELRCHLQKVSASYASGLFHCYDLANVPRTNNTMECLFRDLQHRLLRTMGQRAACRRRLHRLGAWELLPSAPTQAACEDALRSVEPVALAEEQQRLSQHLQRFRLHTRSKRRATAQLDLLEQQWFALPATLTG